MPEGEDFGSKSGIPLAPENESIEEEAGKRIDQAEEHLAIMAGGPTGVSGSAPDVGRL